MNIAFDKLKVSFSWIFAGVLLISLPSIGFSQITMVQAGGSCSSPTRVCTKDSITVENTANGTPGNNVNSPSCASLPFNQSTYMLFRVKQMGTLNFTIKPESKMSEYDWYLFEFQGCGNDFTKTPGEINCNFANNKKGADSTAWTGMSPDGKGNASNQFVFSPEITVDKGKEYLLQIDHYGEYISGSRPNTTPNPALGYNLIWGGTFEIEPIRDFTVNGKSDDNQIFCCAPYSLDFVNTSEYAGNITWDFGNTQTGAGDNGRADYPTGNTYNVTLTIATPDNCTYTRQKTVIIQPKPYLYIPNAFSPVNNVDNNDQNSVFDVEVPSQGVLSYTITIYDRWGKKQFSSTDPTQKWNGGVDNDLSKLCPLGIYVYSIHAEFAEGSIYNEAGTVAITN